MKEESGRASSCPSARPEMAGSVVVETFSEMERMGTKA